MRWLEVLFSQKRVDYAAGVAVILTGMYGLLRWLLDRPNGKVLNYISQFGMTGASEPEPSKLTGYSPRKTRRILKRLFRQNLIFTENGRWFHCRTGKAANDRFASRF